jgi:hypothetical protein
MAFLALVDAPLSSESMKFPVFSLLAGNLGIFRDAFAADSPLQRRVHCEPEFLSMAWRQPTGSAEVGCQTRGGGDCQPANALLGCRLDGLRCPLVLRQQPAAIFR